MTGSEWLPPGLAELFQLAEAEQTTRLEKLFSTLGNMGRQAITTPATNTNEQEKNMSDLPTKPGLYLDIEDDIWRYDSYGWRMVARPEGDDDPSDYIPMRRLVLEEQN